MRQVGYDFTGRKSSTPSQLPAVVAAFSAWKQGERVEPSPLYLVTTRRHLGEDWLATPHFSRKEPAKQPRRREAAFWELGTLASEISNGKTAARSEYRDTGVHIVKVGNLTGRGIEWGCIERQYVSEEWAKKYAWAELRRDDILFTAAAHGPKWIGLKVDMFNTMPSRFGSSSLYCAEIMRVRLRPDAEVDPLYVLLFLRSPGGYAEIQRCIRGQSGHVYKEQIADVRVPRPGRPQAESIDKARVHLTNAIARMEQAQELLTESDVMLASLFPSAIPKPLIAR